MRRKYLGLAIAAITAIGPASAFGGDREIASEIMSRLKTSRDAGDLQGFTLDMKVDQGVVLFRGSVSEDDQKQLVLKAANGVEGVAKVVDELAVKAVAKTVKPQPRKVSIDQDQGSLRELLGESKPATVKPKLEIAPGNVMPTAAVELAGPAGGNDQKVVAGVVQALGDAQKAGRLKGFGIDVDCKGGVVTLKGQAANQSQRQQIIRITQAVPGVQAVDQMIEVARTGTPAKLASNRMAPVGSGQVPTMAAPYNTAAPVPMQQASVPMQQASAPMMGAPMMGAPMMGAPVQGQPVAMQYGGAAVGAPRYEAPNLPNYAWPGYASHPNYAALTYPQQYSPSAWPYIGPFYPYPQVPMGWRRVSLEWDDGWWNLDFTDR